MGAWQPYTPGDPSVPLVPAPGVEPHHVAALPQQLAVYQVSMYCSSLTGRGETSGS